MQPTPEQKRIMSDSTIPEADAAETKFRAEWLHKHKAHKDWIILSVSEVAVIRDELLAVKRERDEAREIARELRDAMGKLVALNTAMKSDDCTYERAYYSYYKGQYDKWESAAAALTKAK